MSDKISTMRLKYMEQLHLFYFITMLNALDTHHRDVFDLHLLRSFSRCRKWRADRMTANKSWMIALHHARSLARACTSTLQIGYVDINMWV
jgi:hypothetical protein